MMVSLLLPKNGNVKRAQLCSKLFILEKMFEERNNAVFIALCCWGMERELCGVFGT